MKKLPVLFVKLPVFAVIFKTVCPKRQADGWLAKTLILSLPYIMQV